MPSIFWLWAIMMSILSFILLQATIIWKRCAELPMELTTGKTAVISGKVYCGGGEMDNRDNECNVFCYDPSQDKWTTLPPLPVKFFGLGQVDGKLVAVGGVKRFIPVKETNEVYTFDQQSQNWKQTVLIPPMPTARWSPGVLSLQSALVVAGGLTLLSSYTAAVDIFKPDTSQWYRTDPLPTNCCNVSLAVINDICYVLGGYKQPIKHLNQALYASVDDLLGNAIPANHTTHSGSSDTQSAWKTLPNTPIKFPIAAVLAGMLLTPGGRGEGGDPEKEVYMYSPSTNSWIHFSDLPGPRASIALAVLSLTEILVIGGWKSNGVRVKTVYKGTYMLC